MPILSVEHFEKIHHDGTGCVIGILQTDGKHKRDVTYLIDSQQISADAISQRSLFHTEFELDEREGQNYDYSHIGKYPYKRVFYNLYDMRDTSRKTINEGAISPPSLWQLDSNSHHDNYCPVLKEDPVEFTGRTGVFYVLTKPTNESPLIKTTDLLVSRKSITDGSNGRITTTEWAYQISSSTTTGNIPTYGYATLSNLEYPGINVPISSFYLYIDSKPLYAAVAKLSPYTTVGAISSRINAVGCTTSQLEQLTSNFGLNWQEGIVSGYKWDGKYGAKAYESYTLCAFYQDVIHHPASYVDYVSYMGDIGLSALQVNKYKFDKLDYNYICFLDTNQDGATPYPFHMGDIWQDMLYGKNSYTARYSQQFRPDGTEETEAVPGNFNRAREYSGIGIGGAIAFLKYYDDLNYKSTKGAMNVVVQDSDFSTIDTHSIKPGDAPSATILYHENDIKSPNPVTKRSYPHIEQILEINVMANRTMHPSNLYRIELNQEYLRQLLRGIQKQLPAEEAVNATAEIRTNITNSIREIARKFAPATTELLTVDFPV